MLRPARRTIVVGRLDQRALCSWSSKENNTPARCFWSSVERKVFAALTILGVAVWAPAAITDTRNKIDLPTPAPILIEDLPPVLPAKSHSLMRGQPPR